jgi:hypothetical protein
VLLSFGWIKSTVFHKQGSDGGCPEPMVLNGSSIRVNKEYSKVGEVVSYRVFYASHPRCALFLFVLPLFWAHRGIKWVPMTADGA